MLFFCNRNYYTVFYTVRTMLDLPKLTISAIRYVRVDRHIDPNYKISIYEHIDTFSLRVYYMKIRIYIFLCFIAILDFRFFIFENFSYKIGTFFNNRNRFKNSKIFFYIKLEHFKNVSTFYLRDVPLGPLSL